MMTAERRSELLVALMKRDAAAWRAHFNVHERHVESEGESLSPLQAGQTARRAPVMNAERVQRSAQTFNRPEACLRCGGHEFLVKSRVCRECNRRRATEWNAKQARPRSN
jgi:ribosomal protein L37E